MMSENTKFILNYIDGNMSDEKHNAFTLEIKKNNELKEELLLINELNSFMKGKLMSESSQNETNFTRIENEARDDVNDFLLKGQTDNEISDYLLTAFPERNVGLIKQLSDAEQEAKLNGIHALTKEWTKAFEKEAKKDKTLLKLIQTSKKQADKSQKKTIPIFKKQYFKYVAVAASIALLFLLNTLFNSRPINEQIFADYHQTPEKLTGTQSRNAEQNTLISFEEAVKLYNTGKYKQAYNQFHLATIQNKNFVQAQYYSGLALFEAEKYAESVEVFKQVLTNFDTYHLEAEWYLSLAYIKLNQTQKALPYLKNIASQKNIWQQNAKDISEKLKP